VTRGKGIYDDEKTDRPVRDLDELGWPATPDVDTGDPLQEPPD